MMEQTYTILGVKLAFPCKAYPTQLSMMSMIIKGIDRRQNCLLESPTGSGKSLALLCSSLGWQAGEREKQQKAAAEAYNKADYIPIDDESDEDSLKKPCTCSCNKASTSTAVLSTSPPGSSTSTAVPNASTQDDEKPCKTSLADEAKEDAVTLEKGEKDSKDEDKRKKDDDDFDFQPSKKRSRKSVGPMGTAKKTKRQKGVVFDDDFEDVEEQSPNPHTKAHWEMKLVTPQAKAGGNELSASKNDKSPCACSCHSSKCQKMMDQEEKKMKNDGDPKPIKVPRIYFGTRTHKQIAQIIRELGRTAYKSVRMSILGSREHTCVHPEVSKSKNKNEGCKELLDGKTGGSCRYFTNVHKMKQQWQIRDYGLTEAWDIEDLVALGKRIKACPYFSSRSLKDQADVIFCPYNYLIDPMIRESMEIDLKDQVVILDEAHNIEDSAREAASLKVTTEQLQDATDELDKLLTFKFRVEHTRVMHTVSSSLLRWINDYSHTLRQNDFDRASRMWSGQEMVAALANMGISPGTLGTLQHHLAALLEDEDERGIKEMGPTLGAASGSLFKGLFVIFNFLFKDDMKFTKDYKVALLKTKARNQFPDTNDRWIHRRRSKEAVWTLSLNFWCLNPAVAFTDFGNAVRTIILTSGTLSPMSSFASELGVSFPIQLEANHVINKSQVWVSSLAFGPNGHSLNASYRNTETFAFQDDLGRVVLEVCRVIPYGVLCFVSSYSMMNKVIERWKSTGLYDQLQSLKSVMCEARGGDKSVFDEQLREFYDTIKECEENGLENQPITGVLMFAVCRGKISEGMDFADNNARAVITVGIPYPNVRDAQVEAKRHYNDQYAASRGLLSGSEWYEVQAYRALNQALGRCIRHKKDWGAILLIDERFSRNPKKYISGISKWVRGKVTHHSQARDALTSLSEFANVRMQASPDADTSVFDGSQPNSQTLSPVTPGASSLNTSNLSHSSFHFNHQSSMPGTPECATTSRMDRRNHTQQESGMLPGRSNVGQLFVPMSKNASTPTSHWTKDAAPLKHHAGQHGSMDGTSLRGNTGHQMVASEEEQEQTRGRKPRRERKPRDRSKGKKAQEKLQAGQKVPHQQTLLSFSPAAGSSATQDIPKPLQLGVSLINKIDGEPQVVVMNSKTSVIPKAQQESATSIPVESVESLPSIPVQGREIIDLTSPVKNGPALSEVQRVHIPTPKAKLHFDEESVLKEQEDATKKSPTSFASKLSRFAFTKDENDNAAVLKDWLERSLGNVANQTSSMTRDCTEEVPGDGALKGDQKTIPSSDNEEEENMEAEERRRRREEDSGTPVLFDSEMGDSGSDTTGKPISFCSEGIKTELEEPKKDSTRDASKQDELHNGNNNHYAADKTVDRTEIKMPNVSDHVEEKGQHRSTSKLSTKGRRNLSRRKDQNGAEEKEKEKTRSLISVRKSAKTRRTPRKVIESISTEQSRYCKNDVECVHCGTSLVQSLDGVSCLQPEDITSEYLLGVIATRRRSQSASCGYPGKTEEGSMIVTDTSNLRHCGSINSEKSSGLQMNAFWSSEDVCCYQPITCSVCNDKRHQDPNLSTTPPMVGYSVVAAGPQSVEAVGKSYICAEEVACCTVLLSQKNKGPKKV